MSYSLEQLFDLYRQAFPANERRDESDLLHALTTPAYRVLTKDHHGELIAFAILFVPPGRTFALLEYLAVHPGKRSQGIGREVVKAAIDQTPGRHLLTEVESESNGPIALRRQHFYARCGFRRIQALNYQLPLPGNPPPMQLWVYPRSAALIDRTELALWITTIYTAVYRCSSADPRIGQMLATVPPAI
jgi:GNAT superfamily N-acetyltransferase